jgi:geranylgeranyl reductase family protein
VFPRDKTCGDGLTPRSVRQIADMGIEGSLAGAHRYTGLRAHAFGRVLDLPWPDHPTFPPYGYVLTRHDLDAIVAERAAKAGATVWQGTEAVEPIVDERAPDAIGPGPSLPSCIGAVVKEKATGATRVVRARYVVVADGANSRFGRALGTSRDRDQPMGMALRGYYTSPGHDQPFIESHLDIRDADGGVVPGYGWIFPMGDGRVNVGVGLLATDRRWKGLNTSTLMEHFVAYAPAEWELSPATALGSPTGGKLPMGLAVGPRIGATTLVVGDAGGSINPFNGEGIAYGYETGRGVTGRGPERRRHRRPGPLRGQARGQLRALLPGGPGLRAGDQPSGAHAAVRGYGDPVRAPHELDPPDHGQPAPTGRDRPGRGRLSGPGHHRPDASRRHLIRLCPDSSRKVGRAVVLWRAAVGSGSTRPTCRRPGRSVPPCRCRPMRRPEWAPPHRRWWAPAPTRCGHPP